MKMFMREYADHAFLEVIFNTFWNPSEQGEPLCQTILDNTFTQGVPTECQ